MIWAAIKKKLAQGIMMLLLSLLRSAVALRYRVHLKGWEVLQHHRFDSSQGILFLPNHPAEIDPILLELWLYSRFALRPLIVEHFYYIKGFRFLMDLVGALVLPDMAKKANKYRAERIRQRFDELVKALQSGSRLLVYPAGRLKMTEQEQLGGASFVHDLLHACPQVQMVLVRTTGLWGSLFSRALTGKSPPFGASLLQGIKILLKNGIFFTPRRDVWIEFNVNPSDFPRQGSRLEINQYLERWYNQPADRIALVPYFFWSKQVPEVVAIDSQKEKIIKPVSTAVIQEVIAFLSALSKIAQDKVVAKAHLSNDLGLDSLDLVQIYLFLDEKYGISDLQSGVLVTVEDVFQAAAGHLSTENKSDSVEPLPPFVWKQETRDKPSVESAASIQEAFLKKASRMGGAIACVDTHSTPLTYRQLKQRALILSRYVKSLQQERIGVMLPSSTAAYLVILAILLAGKVPVMLNWTVGVKALDHAVDLLDLKHVLTSIRFLDRIPFEDLGQVEQRFYFLEEIKEELSWSHRCQGLLLSMLCPTLIKRVLSLQHQNSQDTAVFLFTSGTESLPKAVPLSHANLLSNQRAALEAVTLLPQDIIYGVLPPFHSFGFSITGIFPLLAGIRVCYSPDPTDSHGMARDMGCYRPTIFCAAPSFMTALFKVAPLDALTSLRLVVCGAEKTPQMLFDYVQEHLPNAQLIEGYGITECSPVVTIDRVGKKHVGVGEPLPGTEIVIVDPATKEPLPFGQEGEIAIAGPQVFNGYFPETKNPFIDLGSVKFYLSGDRGYLDDENHLVLTGRLKRFVKIGGEMVSLGGVEEVLKVAYQEIVSQQEGPCIAMGYRETEAGKPELVLFTTLTLSKEEINRQLSHAGFGRVVKISHVHQMPSIPLMGTGKIHYRNLDELKL